MSNRFTQLILIAMALGIVMGTLVFNYLPDSRVEIAADVNLIAMAPIYGGVPVTFMRSLLKRS